MRNGAPLNMCAGAPAHLCYHRAFVKVFCAGIAVPASEAPVVQCRRTLENDALLDTTPDRNLLAQEEKNEKQVADGSVNHYCDSLERLPEMY